MFALYSKVGIHLSLDKILPLVTPRAAKSSINHETISNSSLQLTVADFLIEKGFALNVVRLRIYEESFVPSKRPLKNLNHGN